jgi:catechol 2,3-dioxygenase-like lactoylglutathione lyase family enzyme
MITVGSLTQTYPSRRAVDDLSFDVGRVGRRSLLSSRRRFPTFQPSVPPREPSEPSPGDRPAARTGHRGSWTRFGCMKPLAVHHVSVNVTNPERSIAFYTEILGGTVRADRPAFEFGGAWINLGATQVHLIEADVPPNMGQHFAVLVDDVDHVVRELRAKGIEVEDARVVGPDRQTFVDDPDGNAIELHQIGTATS